jgi:hypothetical protein
MKTYCSFLLLVVWSAAGCSSPGGDTGACDPADCQADCERQGYARGSCSAAGCNCSGAPEADADADGDEIEEGGADADGDGDADDDAPEAADDAAEWEADPCAPASCGPVELCGETGNGDGVDNDCDTQVDEDCICGAMGTTLPCFPGDPATCPEGSPCRGDCTRGVESCTEFAMWSDCLGAVTPVEERCDGADNDCDGLYDEEIPGCDSPVICPGTVSASPMTWVPLDGGSIFPHEFDSWQWELFCPVTVATCPTPEDPAARDTRVLLISSGTYRARATIHVGDDIYTCEFAIVQQGLGLRVELNWDTQGSAHGDTDVDLHLHKFGAETEFCSDDDCYFSNCKASTYDIDWGLEPTLDLAACRDAPHGEGETWETEHGACFNPRLDVDVIYCDSSETDPRASFCAPENINVDDPPLGEPFRVLVNYWSAHSYPGITNATVNIYCGGALRATFGPQPLRVSGGCDGENWLVADVQFYVGACGALDCEIVPLTRPTGENWVQTGTAFGPAWSAFEH